MKKGLKIFLIVFAAVEILGLIVPLCLLFGLRSLLLPDTPFADLRWDVEAYTYSVKNTDFEVELEREDVSELRQLLGKVTFIAPATGYGVVGADYAETINLCLTNGEKHSILLRSDRKILGVRFGVMEYNGQGYLVSYWQNKFFEELCEPYREEYDEWKKTNPGEQLC